MAIIHRYLISLLILAMWGGSLAYAAEPASAAKQAVEVEFSVFGTRAFQGLAYLSATSPKPTALKFYSVHLSASYAYKGDPVIKFYNEAELTAALQAIEAEKAANPNAPVPPLKLKPVAVCTLPAGMKKAVFLFFPRAQAAGENGGLCEIYPMDMDLTKVPVGHLVVINASGRDFLAQVNSTTTTLSRGVSQPFGAERGKISVKIARLEPEFQNVVSSDRWNLTKSQRRLWVLFPMMNSTDVFPDARCLVDTVSVAEKTQGYETAMASAAADYTDNP
jgi:hypothetical protein